MIAIYFIIDFLIHFIVLEYTIEMLTIITPKIKKDGTIII